MQFISYYYFVSENKSSSVNSFLYGFNNYFIRMTRGTESGDQRNVASAVNPGGSWKPGDDAERTQGHIAFGPCEDPIKQEVI